MLPADIVAASRPECERLPEHRCPKDCVGTSNGDGTASVASGAGALQPPISTQSLGMPPCRLESVAALYAMRAWRPGSLCAGFLANGAELHACWRGSPIAPVAAVAALTPMVLFSDRVSPPPTESRWQRAGVVVQPACFVENGRGRPDTRLLVVATVSGAILVTLRSVGPLWLVLILATVLIWTSPHPQPLLRLHRFRGGLVAYGALAASGLASIAWTISQDPLNLGAAETKDVSLGKTLIESGQIVPLWFLQGIGAFPYRDQLAPLPVYVLFVVLGLIGLEGAVRYAPSSSRPPLAASHGGVVRGPVRHHGYHLG